MPILRVSKQDGLSAIYNALAWLSQNGLAEHTIERFDGYPILRVHSQRDILSTLSLLEIEAVSDDPREASFLEKYQSPENPPFRDRFAKDQAIGFTYVDHASPYQTDIITKLFTGKFGASEGLCFVRSDKQDGTGRSIAEKITNLIAAKYFMSKGYMVREDRGIS